MAGASVGPRYFGWNHPGFTSTDMDVVVGGTVVATFDDATNDLVLPTNGLTITAGGLTVAAGGLTVSAGSVTLPANSILTAAVEDNLIQYTDTQLTDTNVKALNGTPITLVAAPGANKSIIVHRVLIVADASNTAWTEPSAPDDLMIEYADGVDIFAAGTIEATALIANSVNVSVYGPLDSAVVPDVNAVVRITNPNADWTGGNAANTMSIRVWYSVVDTVAFS